MAEFERFWPFLVIILIALVTTAIACWKTTLDSTTKEKDFLGFPVWFIPLGYLVIAWLFGGSINLNKPISILGALFVYGLSVVILFKARHLPSDLKWYYPIRAAVVILIIANSCLS
ncbi:MAG: hypothetical protein WCT51_04615 [Candidatus Shapirobacteria bacterium]|jgi:peptidoglycan/LPS O-acetylase OafA/YrhL